MPFRIAIAAFGALTLAACGQQVQDLAGAAGDVAEGAMSAAGAVVTTQNACMIAGQSEAFCGCLQAEVGERLTGEQVKALGEVIQASLGGDIAGAANAAGLDERTRQAIGKCAVQGAISEAGQ
jgi:formylmethanofuran:tetrahydromethanopterin formyltransferase